MATKFYLKRKGYGKHYFYVVHQATGTKLKSLERSKTKIFNSRKEALEHAMDLKKR